MKLKLSALVLLAFVLVASATTIIWYHQNTHAPSLQGTDILAVERQSASTYYYCTLSELGTFVVTNLVTGTNFFDSLTVTNGLTNLSLTANTVLKADANKRIASIPNGTGALTNNNAGLFGWYTYASLGDLNSASNSILSQFTNTINTTSNAILAQMTNSINTVSNNLVAQLSTNTIFTNATVLVEQIDYLTNLCTMAPNFAKGYCAITTNASFTFLLPINLDATKTRVQTTVMRVDNSTGPTPIAVTPPVNVAVVPGSVMWITNSTWFTFCYYAPDQTNVYAVPIK